MGYHHMVPQLRQNLANIRAADSADALAKIYVEFIGYDPFLEDPAESIQSVRSTLGDYVAEQCYALGLHVSLVFD